MEKLLIVEDNEHIRGQMRLGFSKDYQVIEAADRSSALHLFRAHAPKVIALDLGLPPDENGSQEGFHCLEEILRIDPATRVIMITGNADRQVALRSVQSGAFDYYCKPVNISELKVIISRAFYLAAIERENNRFASDATLNNAGPGGIIGQSTGMQEVFSSIAKVSQSDVAVLITGESGTGKELVARAIHSASKRKSGAYIALNCGAIPENLIEAELFGYEKGAFSGAHSRVQGKVEFAHRGTLFLDEIGDLPLNLQVKLLRFLQEKSIQRVGGREDIPVDARIITATNRDIAKEAADGIFREDLFYRISVIHIKLPPLRERNGDIMLLAEMFLRRYSSQLKKKVRRFSAASARLLESYDWPGNVRELENKVQRAVIMSESAMIEPAALGFAASAVREKTVTSGLTLRDAREKIEREMIVAAMANKHNNMAKAAEMLGISRPTLYDLAKKHCIIRSLEA